MLMHRLLAHRTYRPALSNLCQLFRLLGAVATRERNAIPSHLPDRAGTVCLSTPVLGFPQETLHLEDEANATDQL